ncbi:single-stranded DNA-binding protein [Clostridium akagii]|uniref:single-stranded DNA-binding protein n=1 Tax=Clostridium akagii TaxID=91623 RepID=UPI000479D000|nr:single-stranded DNA-binding protein [Clostridium akagii]
MNSVCFTGRVANDLILKLADEKKVINFSLAVERKGVRDKFNKKIADFIPCEIWGAKAEALLKHSGKGKLLSVKGELHLNPYIKDNVKKIKTTVIVNETDILQWNESNEDDIPYPGKG